MAGRLVHFEIPAGDADRAQRFYEQLFGWSFSGWEGGPIDYRMTQASGDPGGAVWASDSGATGVLVYFDTEDIDAYIARVRELGGEAEDKQPVPGMGWTVACKDPEGNAIGLWQADESAPAD
jgi:predicted enzyme related to lactoylglutathione lyase